MHYAVPRILYDAGFLYRLYTDACAASRWIKPLRFGPVGCYPRPLQRLVGRMPDRLPSERIKSFPQVSLTELLRGRRATPFSADLAQAFLRSGRRLNELAIKRGCLRADAVYGFNSASLTLLRAAKQRGVKTVYEQTIAPVQVEQQLLREEKERWPDWEKSGSYDEFYEPFTEVEREEHRLADTIVCGSSFVRDAVIAQGYAAGQVVSVPYGVSSDLQRPVQLGHAPEGRKLRVLTVGAVGLRKGAPYVAAAAAELADEAAFRWAGKVGLAHRRATEMKRFVDLIGVVPRSEMDRHYEWADVLLLPSICEGSATVTYEAIQHGLPLVVTPNTGAPVESDYPGVVPIRDVEAMVRCLRSIRACCDRWRYMHANSVSLAPDLTVDAYGERLLNVIEGLPRGDAHEVGCA